MSFPMATKTLLFAGRGGNLIAMDKATGEIIGELGLNGADGAAHGRVSGPPMTDMHEGKQYITMAWTQGRRGGAKLVALALP